MCEVTTPDKPMYDDPRWQLPVTRIPDDPVNAPLIHRFLTEQRRLAEQEASKADEPAASGKPKRRKPLPAD